MEKFKPEIGPLHFKHMNKTISAWPKWKREIISNKPKKPIPAPKKKAKAVRYGVKRIDGCDWIVDMSRPDYGLGIGSTCMLMNKMSRQIFKLKNARTK